MQISIGASRLRQVSKSTNMSASFIHQDHKELSDSEFAKLKTKCLEGKFETVQLRKNMY